MTTCARCSVSSEQQIIHKPLDRRSLLCEPALPFLDV
jgi:hypothetical protein